MMSRYLRTYFIIMALLVLACIIGLWAVSVFDLRPQMRLLVLIITAGAMAGFTRLFWIGRRDDD